MTAEYPCYIQYTWQIQNVPNIKEFGVGQYYLRFTLKALIHLALGGTTQKM